MAGLQIGKTIYDTIKDETDLIYPNVAVMIRVGEETAHFRRFYGKYYCNVSRRA